MTTSFTIYGYDANPRTRIVRIVAAAEDITFVEVQVVPRNGINKIAYLERFPLSRGKIPAIEGPGIKITETIAIAIYLSKLRNRSHLLGSAGNPEQEALVLSYACWANQELLPTLARWFLPLIPDFSVPAPYDFVEIENGKATSLALLVALEQEIVRDKENGQTGWLVGDGPTLADIFVAVVVSRGLQWVLDYEWREQHPGIMSHFEKVSNWGPVREVIPHFELIMEETRNVDPVKSAQGN